MYSHKYVLLLFVIIRADAEIITDSKFERSEEHDDLFQDTERRHMDRDDSPWHVTHLKESDFDIDARKSGCKEETFQQKLKKYRRSLKNDGALVQFVSAHPLPFDEKQLIEESCVLPNDEEKDPELETLGFKTIDELDLKPKAEEVLTKTSVAETSDKLNSTVAFQLNEPINTKNKKTNHKAYTKANKAEKATTDNKNSVHNITATESNDKEVLTTAKIKAKKNTNETDTGRRASEYLFTDVEYYDDVVEFDPSTCPGVIDVIVLEQDLIRNYDVECELTLEWRSLE